MKYENCIAKRIELNTYLSFYPQQAAVEHFKGEKTIHRRYVARLLIGCKRYFETLSSLMEISIPHDPPSPDVAPRVTVCGDTHGQFYE
jgi:serine/threonine-protein phosphatase 5